MKPWAQVTIALSIAAIIISASLVFASLINATIEDAALSKTTAANTAAKSKPPATDEESLTRLINYIRVYGEIVVWRDGGQREVWQLQNNDVIILNFYTGSGPLADPTYDPGEVLIRLHGSEVMFGKTNKAGDIEWSSRDTFGFPEVLARALKETG